MQKNLKTQLLVAHGVTLIAALCFDYDYVPSLSLVVGNFFTSNMICSFKICLFSRSYQTLLYVEEGRISVLFISTEGHNDYLCCCC